MAPVVGIQSGRNKLLHRFYEPLVLLFALDRVQGDHLYSDRNRHPLEETTNKELRRRFLASLSYICDYQKGGDTITAIAGASNPLTYYVASNKTPQDKVKTFLESVFYQLGQVHDMNSEERIKMENELFEECARFSEQRIQTYWRFLQLSMRECSGTLQDEAMVMKIRDLIQCFEDSSKELIDLCQYCYTLMRSEDIEFIREMADKSIRYGTTRSPFIAARHYIGRLASHVKNVKVLIAAAVRLPELILDPEIVLIESPNSIVLPPPVRSKLKLDKIANRMVPPRHGHLLSELQTSLQILDQKFDVEQTVHKEYLEKRFKARVHAELIILEYFYEREETLQYLDNDPFIGCSKPACYCCSLYFRHHPANVEPPGTHQKIYLNWLPPTSVSGVEDPKSRLALHEKEMLNRMVENVRLRTIEQIRNQTGRRQSHFDSTTGETVSARAMVAFKKRRQMDELPIAEDTEPDNENDSGYKEIAVTTLLENVKLSHKTTQSDEDSDHGGVQLL